MQAQGDMDQYEAAFNEGEPAPITRAVAAARPDVADRQAYAGESRSLGMGLYADGDAAPAVAREQSFEEALKEAKDKGEPSFPWRGRTYSTGLANDRQPEARAKPAARRPAAKPAARPAVAPAVQGPSEEDVRAAGRDVMAVQNALANAPAETSPAARAAAQKLRDETVTDYDQLAAQRRGK